MYGRRLHFSWFHFCAVACALLQIARADFTQNDSSVLADIATDVDAMRGLLNTQQGDVGAIADSLSSLLTAWDNSIPYIKSDTAYIPSVASTLDDIEHILRFHLGGDSPGDTAVYATLLNIEANTEATAETVIDIKDDLVLSISNGVALALASVPLCYNVATNLSSGVDLTMVTNLATYLIGNIDPATFNGRFDGLPLYELLSDYFGALYGDGYYSDDDFDMLWASSFLGFLQYLHLSALFPLSVGHTDSSAYNNVWDYWHNGLFGGLPSPDYTIFDAYNTLGLGVLTNQVASVTNALDTLVSVNVGGTNLLNKIFLALTDRDGPVSAIASAVAAVSNAVESSGQVDLDYARKDKPVEWEEEYHGGISEYTNFTRYAQYGEQFSEGLTNQLKRFTEQLNTVPAVSDSTLDITFSGWEFRGLPYMNAGPYHGWTLSLGADPTSPEYEGFSDLTHGIWLVVFRLLEACAIILSCRRIYQIVFPSGYFDVGL